MGTELNFEGKRIAIGVPRTIPVGSDTNVYYAVYCTYRGVVELNNSTQDQTFVLDEDSNDVQNYKWFDVPGEYTIEIRSGSTCPSIGPDKAPLNIYAKDITLRAEDSPTNMGAVDGRLYEEHAPTDFNSLDLTFYFGPTDIDTTFMTRWHKPTGVRITDLELKHPLRDFVSAKFLVKQEEAPQSLNAEEQLLADDAPTGISGQEILGGVSRPESLNAEEQLLADDAPTGISGEEILGENSKPTIIESDKELTSEDAPTSITSLELLGEVHKPLLINSIEILSDSHKPTNLIYDEDIEDASINLKAEEILGESSKPTNITVNNSDYAPRNVSITSLYIGDEVTTAHPRNVQIFDITLRANSKPTNMSAHELLSFYNHRPTNLFAIPGIQFNNQDYFIQPPSDLTICSLDSGSTTITNSVIITADFVYGGKTFTTGEVYDIEYYQNNRPYAGGRLLQRDKKGTHWDIYEPMCGLNSGDFASTNLSAAITIAGDNRSAPQSLKSVNIAETGPENLSASTNFTIAGPTNMDAVNFASIPAYFNRDSYSDTVPSGLFGTFLFKLSGITSDGYVYEERFKLASSDRQIKRSQSFHYGEYWDQCTAALSYDDYFVGENGGLIGPYSQQVGQPVALDFDCDDDGYFDTSGRQKQYETGWQLVGVPQEAIELAPAIPITGIGQETPEPAGWAIPESRANWMVQSGGCGEDDVVGKSALIDEGKPGIPGHPGCYASPMFAPWGQEVNIHCGVLTESYKLDELWPLHCEYIGPTYLPMMCESNWDALQSWYATQPGGYHLRAGTYAAGRF